MQRARKNISTLLFILLAVSTSFCSKEDNGDNNPNDPSNLQVEIVSIDHETAFVEIQATAQNANLYQLYIGTSEDPEDWNDTGYFEYTFDGQGTHEFTVRAYGASGRYVKVVTEVKIAEEEDLVPLSRGYFSPLEYDGFDLVWQDEFNGNSLSSEDWSYDIGNGVWGWGNNELQYYRSQNAQVADSVITIEARDEAFSGFNYTSAKIKTQGKKEFQYGRIDMRALLPKGQGIWPALWTLGSNHNSIGWPDCGEIDIMENVGGDGEDWVKGTLHWEFNGNHAEAGKVKTLSSGVYNFNESYHVFSILWDENSIKWFVDGQQFFIIDITGSDMDEFHQSHYLIMNLAVGGNWPGSPDATTIFPQQLKVDYVRVFQQQ